MTKYNAAIYLLSSRIQDLEQCLSYLFKNWNNDHGYPVYVNHFDDIYSDEYISNVRDNISENIHFQQIDYGIPDHIKEEELSTTCGRSTGRMVMFTSTSVRTTVHMTATSTS